MRIPFHEPILRMRLRHTAQTLAAHGWAVTPGAYFTGERMACDRPTCWATSCHPLLPDWENHTQPGDWWQNKPHSVLLPTGRVFDAIDVPVLIGSAAEGICGPVILTPTGRWVFLVRSGSALRAELAEQTDVVLHSAGSWVAAPPTVLPEGPMRWHLSPRQVDWYLPEAHEVQSALIHALVALDASFLDRTTSLRPAHKLTAPSSTIEAALRRAA